MAVQALSNIMLKDYLKEPIFKVIKSSLVLILKLEIIMLKSLLKILLLVLQPKKSLIYLFQDLKKLVDLDLEVEAEVEI